MFAKNDVAYQAANAVIEVAAEYYEIKPADIRGNRRYPKIVAARSAVCYLLHKGGWGFSEIGRAMRVHHTTALAAVRRVERHLGDPGVGSDLEALKSRLSASQSVPGVTRNETPQTCEYEVEQ